MAARIPLGIGLTSAANGASITLRASKPPYLFVAPENGVSGAAWTGSVVIQHSVDTPPLPNNGGGVTNGGVTDANADWTDIGTLNAGGDQFSWPDPLFRVRALTSGITGGNPNVYLLETVPNLRRM